MGARKMKGSDGTTWEIVGADVDAIQGLLATADTMNEPAQGTVPANDLVWEDAENVTLQYNSWTNEECSSVSSTEDDSFNVYSGESIYRQQQLDTWEENPVSIVGHIDGERYGCNGIFVGPDDDTSEQGFILTAAHCVANRKGELAARIEVCAHGGSYPNEQCRYELDDTLDEVIVAPDYHHAWPRTADPTDDIALIKIDPTDGFTTPQYDAMKLSEAPDSFVTPKTMRTGSFHEQHFDAHTDSCTDGLEALKDGICFCQANSKSSPVPNSQNSGSFLLTQSTSSFHSPATTSRFRWRADGGEGFSGSGLYYCGSTTCSITPGGARAGVVSVWSSWNPVVDRFVGPKVRNHRALFLPQMD